jgi:hypothetical protein
MSKKTYIFCVYTIRNTVNKKEYHGYTTKRPQRRFAEHLKASKLSRKALGYNSKLYRAMKKYGPGKFYVAGWIELGPGMLHGKTHDQAQAIVGEMEKIHIARTRSIENGYNITTGGMGGGGEASVKGGRKGGRKVKKMGTGLFGMSTEEKNAACRKGGRKAKAAGTGIFSPEMLRIGGLRAKENHLGIFAPEYDWSKSGRKGAITNKKNHTAIFALE